MANSPQNRGSVGLPCLPKNASMSAIDDAATPPQGESDMGSRTARARRIELGSLANMRTQLAALETMTVSELAERFRDLFGVPTRTRNKEYLRKRIAWRIQEQQE